MDRINGTGTILNGAGKRIFQNQNLAFGISGTELDAGFFTDLQEELVAGLIEKSGQTPGAGSDLQVYSAILTMFCAPQQLVLATTTLTVPAWAYRMEFEIVGGGGGGSAATTASQRGAGGGGGGRARGLVNVTPGSSIIATIGAGGAGASSGNGTAGGTTTLAGLVQATGGNGGYGTSPYAGGVSGVGSLITGSAPFPDWFMFDGLGDGEDGTVSSAQPGGGGGGGGVVTGYTAGAGNQGYALIRWRPA
jgi:hypothetical protein